MAAAFAGLALSAGEARAVLPEETRVSPGAIAAAVRYLETRSGLESFAVVDGSGRVRGHRMHKVARAGSVFKAMLLAVYLRRPSVRARALTDHDRSLLGPMIRRSDNATATAIRHIVGPAAIERLARRAGMRRFRLRFPWGVSQITAADQARFFYRFDRFVPDRHRAYARFLLSHVVRSQRWGIARARPPGWSLYFKGGWRSGTGRVDHQVAFLERVTRAGRERVAVAILTLANPSHAYGKETLRGISARLLRDLA